MAGGPVGADGPAFQHQWEASAMKNSSGILAILAVLQCGAVQADYVITDLGTFGGTTSSATAINSLGQVVGTAWFPGNVYSHAYLYSNGVKQDLGTLAAPGLTNIQSTALALNSSGQVVGNSNLTIAGPTHAFLYNGGVMRDLGTLGGSDSNALGINRTGQVVGYAEYNPSSLTTHAFLYSGGVMRDLGTLGGSFSEAFGINDAGQVVGTSYIKGDTALHAFLFSNGIVQDLGAVMGATNSVAYAINNLGQVVGYSENGAFLYADGLRHDLGTLGGNASQALALNDLGEVVGFADTATGARHAFLYSGGVMVDLNGLLPPGSGWVLNQATGINDSGQIVGEGTINGQTHGFLLSPLTPASVPEPGTLALFTTALSGLLAFRLRRCLATRG
jgi:probable HAF family extracellular repeat protein